MSTGDVLGVSVFVAFGAALTVLLARVLIAEASRRPARWEWPAVAVCAVGFVAFGAVMLNDGSAGF